MLLMAIVVDGIFAYEGEEERLLKTIRDGSSLLSEESDLYSDETEIEWGESFGRYEIEVEMDIEEHNLEDFEAILRKSVRPFFSFSGTVYKNKSAYVAALETFYDFPGRIKLEGHFRHDGRTRVKISKVVPIGKKFDLKFIPQFKRVEKMALKNLFGSNSLLDWSFKTEFYYKDNKKFSIGSTYRRGGNLRNSTDVMFKVRF